MTNSICVVGSVNIDLTFRTNRLPQPGETLAGSAMHIGFGGKGANQAVMAARLGAAVALVAKIGADAFGRDALRHLQAEHLETRYIQVDADRPTGAAAIIVDDQARNCILLIAGANHGLSVRDVQDAQPVIAAAGIVLGQLEVPLESTLEAFRLAKAAGARTVLNPTPAQTLPNELLRLADICVPNETELHQLTSMPTGSIGEVTAAARALQNGGARNITVTLGDRGALVVDEAGAFHVPPRRVTAVDTTGAGDAFIGSLAVFLTEGLDLRAAAHKANAVAALAVTRHGAQASLPSRAEVDSEFRGTALLSRPT